MRLPDDEPTGRRDFPGEEMIRVPGSRQTRVEGHTRPSKDEYDACRTKFAKICVFF